MHNIYYLGLSGEHRCPLGYLFLFSYRRETFVKLLLGTLKLRKLFHDTCAHEKCIDEIQLLICIQPFKKLLAMKTFIIVISFETISFIF